MNSPAKNKEIQNQEQDLHHHYLRSTDDIDDFASIASKVVIVV